MLWGFQDFKYMPTTHAAKSLMHKNYYSYSHHDYRLYLNVIIITFGHLYYFYILASDSEI